MFGEYHPVRIGDNEREKRIEPVEKARSYAQGKRHLEGMISDAKIFGFSGLAHGSERIGDLIAEVAKKYLDEETRENAKKFSDDRVPVKTIQEELQGDTGGISREALKNWQLGRNSLNSPEVNAEISNRLVYLNQIARDPSHVESQLALQTLIQLLSPEEILAAVRQFNLALLTQVRDGGDSSKYVIMPPGKHVSRAKETRGKQVPEQDDVLGNIDPNDELTISVLRQALYDRVNSYITKSRVFSAITTQRSSGSASRPSNYL